VSTLLLQHIVQSSDNDALWHQVLDHFLTTSQSGASLHLAVLLEPYLSYILDGRKTVESRFSRRPTLPFGRVSPNDVVLLKRSAGPVIAACGIGAVWSYHLDPDSWSELKHRFSSTLCAEGTFWDDRRHAEYATLMRLDWVRALTPVWIPKRDRRAWAVLKDGTRGRLF